MEINVRKEKVTTIVSVAGRMDALTSPEFEKELSALISAGDSNFLINLQQLEYISSAGLRSILFISRQLKNRNGVLLFAGPQGPVKDVFKISGFNSIFKIFDTEEEALNA